MKKSFYVHFFACPKKRTKEKTADHLSAFGGFPALLTKNGRRRDDAPFWR